jgi:hypothetical protein
MLVADCRGLENRRRSDEMSRELDWCRQGNLGCRDRDRRVAEMTDLALLAIVCCILRVNESVDSQRTHRCDEPDS